MSSILILIRAEAMLLKADSILSDRTLRKWQKEEWFRDNRRRVQGAIDILNRGR